MDWKTAGVKLVSLVCCVAVLNSKMPQLWVLMDESQSVPGRILDQLLWWQSSSTSRMSMLTSSSMLVQGVGEYLGPASLYYFRDQLENQCFKSALPHLKVNIIHSLPIVKVARSLFNLLD
ncbi:hypothetical protein BKA57DRAFT_280609 [Linnemannia elongata]|nr:hypothetical protein BKA57DRAFT_280609 [Linnemannia elongata]